MNDKLHLFIENGLFDYNKQRFNRRPNEDIDPESGEIKSFPKAYRNEEKNGGLLAVDISPFGAYFRFNPNKIMKKQIGSTPLNFQELKDSINTVESYLSDNKIMNCDMGRARISRFDNSFDLKTPDSFDSYLPIIRTLVSDQQAVRNGKQWVYESSVYLDNKSTQIAIYDKGKEQSLPCNYMRLEFRHLRTRSTKFAGIFINKLTPDRYYSIRESDKSKITSYVFGRPPQLLAENKKIDNKIVAHFLELVTKGTLKPALINRETVAFLLRTYELTFGTSVIQDILKRESNHKNYRQLRAYINLIKSTNITDSVYIKRFEELSNLWSKAS